MRGWQAALLMLIAGLATLTTGSRAIQITLLALVAVLVIGITYRFLSTGDVRGSRTVIDGVIAWGDAFKQQITLKNDSRMRIPAIRVTDLSTLPEHPGGYVTSLKAKRSITWNVVIPCRTRGRYRLGPVAAQMSDPLGLFPVERTIGHTSSVLVLPRWVPMMRSALKLDGFVAGEARGRRRGESPPTASSIREYTFGDNVSSIHWRASARTGELVTKLYDPEVQTTLWLALDLDGALDHDIEELLVTTATSYAMYASHQANLRVGLIASGSQPVVMNAERGRPHQYRLQEMLAEVHPGNTVALSDQLTAIDMRLGPGNAVILVTARGPEVWSTWLGRLSRQGVAARVAHIYTSGDATPAADAWPVPSVQLPSMLADPVHEGTLIAYLEGKVRSSTM